MYGERRVPRIYDERRPSSEPMRRPLKNDVAQAPRARFEAEEPPNQLPCEVCGEPAFWWFSDLNSRPGPDLLKFYLCSACGLLFVGTPITPADLIANYTGKDWDSFYAKVAYSVEQKAGRACDSLSQSLSTPNARLLDVGCGHCEFIIRAKSRFPAAEIVGQEFVSHDVPGTCVYTCELDEVPGTFSIVTMLDVLEHVVDPVGFLKRARTVATDELYIHTPCRCVWDTAALRTMPVPGVRRLGRWWLQSRVGIIHLRLWTPAALQVALRDAGFRVETFSRQAELSYPTRNYALGALGRWARLRGLVAVVEVVIRAAVGLGLLRNKAIVLASAAGSETGIPAKN